jgi:hypothetical protein
MKKGTLVIIGVILSLDMAVGSLINKSVAGTLLWVLYSLLGALVLTLIGFVLVRWYLHVFADKKHLDRIRATPPASEKENVKVPPQGVPERIASVSKKTGEESPKGSGGKIFGWAVLVILILGAAFYLQLHYHTFTVLKGFLPSNYHAERGKEARIVTEQLSTGKISEQSAEYIQRKVDEVMAQHPEPIEAPLADGGTNSDAWSPWFQVPTVGIHGFDLNIDPGLTSGKIRMHCTVGNTTEEAESNAHETASGDTLCSPFSWFRLNTVKTPDQTVPIKVRYFFTVKRG